IVAAIVTLLRLPSHADLFGGMLVVSPLNSLFIIICLVLALVTLPLAAAEKNLRNPGEFTALLLLGALGLMLLVGSEELLMIFIGLELLGLSLYVMAAFDKADIRSAEAGLKYFLFGSTASAFTLFGISFIFGMSGATGLAAIGQKLTPGPLQPLLAVGIVMTLIGFAFKIAAAPFHLWAPDAYQRAPTARILSRRSRWLHAARNRCWGTRRIFRNVVLHYCLRHDSRRRIRRCRAGPTPNGWRRFFQFFRAMDAFAVARWMYGGLHVVASWHTAAGRIFRKILPVQRRAARQWKSRPALACRAGALWQPYLAVLLSHCAESDLR